MVYKRATQKLLSAGIANIQIVKRLYGAAPEHILYQQQRSQCFKTPQEAVKAVLEGFRPTEVKEQHGKDCKKCVEQRSEE